MSRLTYGEAFFVAKRAVYDSTATFNDAISISDIPHEPRMNRYDAEKYYTKKINQEFERLGFKRRGKVA